jgi:CheY-like chemotaxis protein
MSYERLGSATMSGTTRPLVLLVEDDDDIRNDLGALLEEEGFDVLTAAHGGEALSILRGGARPDVILLDLMMPTMDGWTFRAEQLADASLSAIPVLLLTAAAADETRTLGAQGCIQKPIRLEHLFSEVRRVSRVR